MGSYVEGNHQAALLLAWEGQALVHSGTAALATKVDTEFQAVHEGRAEEMLWNMHCVKSVGQGEHVGVRHVQLKLVLRGSLVKSGHWT